MKLLLYCTKAKPYLYPHFNNLYFTKNKDFGNVKLNGKIVAECDFEVESMENYFNKHSVEEFNKDCQLYLPEFISYITKGDHHVNDLFHYAKENGNIGYAIHIKNLHIFDKPKELSDFNKIIETPYGEEPDAIITKAPQNMMRCCYEEKPKEWKTGVLISIRPEWLCKILNGEKTIECRKRILKEMITK